MLIALLIFLYSGTSRFPAKTCLDATARMTELLCSVGALDSGKENSIGRNASGVLWKLTAGFVRTFGGGTATVCAEGCALAASVDLELDTRRLRSGRPAASSPDCGLGLGPWRLTRLADRRENELVMLAILSFRMTECAEARKGFSLPLIPGNGKASFV